MTDPAYSHAYRGCRLIGSEPFGHCGERRLAVELADGTTKTLYIDGFDAEDMPNYHAVYDFGVYWTFSDMRGHDIEYVAWMTFKPAFLWELSLGG